VPAVYSIFEVLIRENRAISKSRFLEIGKVLFLKVALDF